jgi:hypothetical protein
MLVDIPAYAMHLMHENLKADFLAHLVRDVRSELLADVIGDAAVITTVFCPS